MKRGDIYLITLDPTLGHEQQGSWPVLVVSPDRFNTLTKVPIVVPITSGGAFARNAGFTVSLEAAGIKTLSLIRCDQLQLLDLLTRKARRLETGLLPSWTMCSPGS